MTKAEEVLESLDTRCRYQVGAMPLCAVHGTALYLGNRMYRCNTTGDWFYFPLDSANTKLELLP